MEEQINRFYTKTDLIALFNKLGIQKGMTVEVHASLSRFGYIVGGAQTFNDALLEVLGYNGTIVMPLHMYDRGEPSRFINPPVAFELQDKYRNEMPAFDKMTSETMFMSDIYENLRRRPKAEISNHPIYPFVALGKYARNLCHDSGSINEPLGKDSIIGKLYQQKAFCLLAGVDYDSMTCLHLSEYMSKVRPYIIDGTSVAYNYQKVWKKYLDVELDSDDGFVEIGKILESHNQVSMLKEGELELKLLRIDTAVEEGIRYYHNYYRYYRGDIG